MIKIFSKKECDEIIDYVNTLTWEHYTKDFEYYQTFIHIDWISYKIKKIIEIEKKISFSNTPLTKVIKLKPSNSLPTHVQRFENTNITFTTVCFLNDDFKGGDYYFNNNLIKIKKGFGVIHDLHSTQKIKEIKSKDCFLLFSHFDKIIPNKLL
jgi:hypothetical protein